MAIDPAGLLVDVNWTNRAINYANNISNSETVYYYIHQPSGDVTFADGSYSTSVGHSSFDNDFIRSVFNQIDAFIDLDFEESTTYNNTLIDIYSVASHSDWTSTILGTTVDRRTYWDIYWKDTDGLAGLNDNDRNTITHEIGHALGLGHPYGNGFNPAYDNSDTVMSYIQDPISGWSTYFTTSDIKALQQIWGVENDIPFVQGYVYRLRNDSTGKFIFSANSGEIDIITGQGWINEGAAYESPTNKTTDLHRFLMSNGGHFYTANTLEKNILLQDSSFAYEGVAYQVYSTTEPPFGALPVIRYLNNSGSHLYSTSQHEQSILDDSPQWLNEGIAWYGESII